MSRIQLTDSTLTAIQKMVEGNPGATVVCMQLVQKGPDIDPDDVFGGIGKILSLDTHRIYGSRIWMLYKDVCEQNIATMIGLLRAVQLGFLPEEDLQHAIDNYGESLDIPELLQKVKAKLPAFGIEVGV